MYPSLRVSCATASFCAAVDLNTNARKAKTTMIGKAKLSVAVGKTEIVKVKLNPTGRALLKAHHGKLPATLTVRKFSPSPATTIRKTVQIVQQGAK
jgi:hypothetical protein